MVNNELSGKGFHIETHQGNTPGSGRRVVLKKIGKKWKNIIVLLVYSPANLRKNTYSFLSQIVIQWIRY